ncbi:MAG: riboflavin synthase [Firmicutes bacterium]|nr:riboflavin synthase [Bacillota bacterium]
MFTGIIEEVGIVNRLTKNSKEATLVLEVFLVHVDTKIGDSIAVNGVCLTVTKIENNLLTFFVMNETIEKTSLKYLKTSLKVNLERALLPTTRLGGHIVSGHVDGIGTISNIEKAGDSKIYSIRVEPLMLRYIIKKGSVAIDGISLTVTEIYDTMFKVGIIPHTQTATNLFDKRVGDTVNIECDMIGKYVEKFMNKDINKSERLSKLLIEVGF